MKFSLVLLASFVTFAVAAPPAGQHANMKSLPACGKHKCAIDVRKASDCDRGDIGCMCKLNGFKQNVFETCVKKACKGKDVTTMTNWRKSTCH